MMRTGVIAKKIGMSRFYSDNGQEYATTILSLEGCQVIRQKTLEKDGYVALQLGAGSVKPQNLNKPQRGHFAVNKVMPRKKIAEFRVDTDCVLDVGVEITADHFVAGQKIDVTGISKGKGFAGGIKRHNFGGGRATHGNSVSHRSLGSTGGCQDPGKVFKGKKMAGQMGDKRVTAENLEIFRTDVDRSLLLIKGAVPGAKGSWVFVRDAIKHPINNDAPMPGAFKVSEEVNHHQSQDNVAKGRQKKEKVSDASASLTQSQDSVTDPQTDGTISTDGGK